MDYESWAQDLLETTLPRRWAHMKGVADRARYAASLFGEAGELLVKAALLHDVGYAPALVDTGFHPLDGARALRALAAPERLVHLVAHHSCAMVEAEQRGLAAELAKFYDERTPLRDALWWADLTSSRDGHPTTVEDRLAEVERRYGPDHVVSRSVRLARLEMLGAVERTEARLTRHTIY